MNILVGIKTFIRNERNSYYNLLANIVRIIGKSVWQMLIPFFLDIGAFAVYSLIQNIYSVLIQTTNLGTRQVILRASDHKLPLLGFLIHSLFIAIPQIVITSFFFEVSWLNTILISTVVLFTNIYINYVSRLKGLELFDKAAYAEILGLVLFLLGSVLLYFLRKNITEVLVIEVGFLILQCFFLQFFLSSINHNGTFSITGVSKYFKGIYQVGIIGLIETVVWRFIPIYFINQTSFKTQGLAIFNLSLLLSNVFILMPQSVIESWIPRIANLNLINKADFDEVQKMKSRYHVILIAIVLLALLVITISLYSIYSKYYDWRFYVIFFSFFRVLFSFTDIYNAVIYAQKKEKVLILPNIFSAVLLCVGMRFVYEKYELFGIFACYLFVRFFLNFWVHFTYNKNFKDWTK